MSNYKKVSFTPDEFEAASERAKYNVGWMRVKVSNAIIEQGQQKEDEKVSAKWHRTKFNVTPLSDPEDPSSTVGRGASTMVHFPIEPEHWEEAVEDGDLLPEPDPENPELPSLEKWRGLLRTWAGPATHELFNAAFGDETVPPKPFKAGSKYFLNGEELERDEAKEKGAEAYQAAADLAEEMVETQSAESLNDCLMYAFCTYEVDKRTGELSDRPSFKYFSREVPLRGKGRLRKPVEILTGAAIMSRGPAKKAEEEGESEVVSISSKGRSSKKAPAKGKGKGKAA
jgi:hypothetical protein